MPRRGSRLARLLCSATQALSGAQADLPRVRGCLAAAAATAPPPQSLIAAQTLHAAARCCSALDGAWIRSSPISSCEAVASGTSRAFGSSSCSSAAEQGSTAAAAAVQDGDAERRPQPGAADNVPAGISGQLPTLQPPVRRPPRSSHRDARPGHRQHAARSGWQPETEADQAAAALADRMQELLRRGQADAAAALFDPHIKASHLDK